ncbi:hypothetical protein [Georgenia wangjunii]|uniref:hypothetical protein n=1 Tax=Georgenia wangjunii TaxID=3117730 RepID=UPI002F26DA17
MTATMPPAWQKQYRVDRHLGRPRMIPSAPVFAHIEQLLETPGCTPVAIGEAAGLARTTVHTMLHLRRPKVKVATARAILAITPDVVLNRSNPDAFVPGIGTRRRVRALIWMGWTHEAMKEESGVTTNVLARSREHVRQFTHDAVAEMYDRLSMREGPSARNRERAVRRGYAPPLAWEDIDNPDEVPSHTALPARQFGGRDGIDLDDFAFLVRSGELPERAARRCGVDLRSVQTRAYRDGRRDVLTLMGIREMERAS